MEKTLHLEYKNRKFALHPFSPESRLIVIDEDSKKAVLECNFPTRNQHTMGITTHSGVNPHRNLIKSFIPSLLA